MKRIKNRLKLLMGCLLFLAISSQYSLAVDDCEAVNCSQLYTSECEELQCPRPIDDADAASSEIDRILEDPDTESRGEFGVIRKDGKYVPYDWRIGLLRHFPKVSAGYLVWFDDNWSAKFGPGIYLTAYTRPDIKNPMFFEYSLPKTLELGVSNQIAMAKIGWLILPIIDLKFDVGVTARFEDNILQDGVYPMVGISLLRL